MNEIREMINISYFDNKNTTLKEHCDIYSNIKKEVLDILNKYDIKYVVAETEAVKDLVKENQQLKEQLELSEQIREKQKDRMNRVKDKIQSVAYGGSEDYYIGIINEIHKLLCVIKEKKE